MVVVNPTDGSATACLISSNSRWNMSLGLGITLFFTKLFANLRINRRAKALDC